MIKTINGYSQIKEPLKNSYVTIGNFDGLHRGHTDIILRLVQESKKNFGTSVVFTFRPHPHMALRQNTKVDLITTYEEKNELLASLGVDYILEQPFNRDFSELTPEAFFNDVLVKSLNTKELVVGYDFAFGKSRLGNLETLKVLTTKTNINLIVREPLRVDNWVCSSTTIRELLKQGSIENANHLLGRSFFYRGLVLKGDGRGRKIGFPTANIEVDPDKIRIKPGVYSSHVRFNSSQQYCHGVTNVGYRPTFYKDPTQLSVETHVLDFSKDIYGEKIQISFIKRIRDEVKFDGISSLTAQIQKDILKARESD